MDGIKKRKKRNVLALGDNLNAYLYSCIHNVILVKLVKRLQ